MEKHIKIKTATARGYDEAHDGDSINLAFPDSNTRRGRVGKGISQTLDTHCNMGVCVSAPEIKRIDVPQMVTVRKYDADKDRLVPLLRAQKTKCKLSNKNIADKLNIPITKVEHWFRQDDGFAIPDANIWNELKTILQMDDITEYDEAIMTFEEREGVYEKSERCYHEDGILPTLTSMAGSEKVIVEDRCKVAFNLDKPTWIEQHRRVYNPDYCSPCLFADYGGDDKAIKITEQDNPKVIGGIGDKKSNGGTQWYLQDRIYDNKIATSVTTAFNPYYRENTLRIRKLTPKECWRLMGFSDEDFEKAEKVNSNAQLYKQAGNSIVVNVLTAIFKEMM